MAMEASVATGPQWGVRYGAARGGGTRKGDTIMGDGAVVVARSRGASAGLLVCRPARHMHQAPHPLGLFLHPRRNPPPPEQILTCLSAFALQRYCPQFHRWGDGWSVACIFVVGAWAATGRPMLRLEAGFLRSVTPGGGRRLGGTGRENLTPIFCMLCSEAHPRPARLRRVTSPVTDSGEDTPKPPSPNTKGWLLSAASLPLHRRSHIRTRGEGSGLVPPSSMDRQEPTLSP